MGTQNLVVNMDTERFEMFLDLVKILEEEDIENDNIEKAFAKLIKHFEGELSPSQRKEVEKLFPSYKPVKRSFDDYY